MKKRIFGILMAILMVSSLFIGAIPAMAAEEGDITVRFHYKRADGEYKGWEMWLWDMDGITTLDPPYDLVVDEANGDAVCEFKVKTGTCKIGYIVRKNGWEQKDVAHDQHINITGVLSGTVDFYVESGVPTQPTKTDIPTRQQLMDKGNLVLGNDVTTGIVVVSANYKVSYTGSPELDVNMSELPDRELTLNDFVISNRDGEIPVTGVRSAGQHIYLTLGETLDVCRGYNVVFEGRQYAVSIPNRYTKEEFTSVNTYTGDDLGATYSADKTTLRVWAPLSLEMNVNLYHTGDPATEEEPYQVVPMTKDVDGTWIATLDGDMNGVYYTYGVTTDNNTNVEACDPYARTTGVNGKRAMIIDLDATDPEGWDKDTNPHAGENFTDAVIYELHVRDASMHESSGVSDANKGKFLGIIEPDTKTPNGKPTGLSHMVDLGVTHVHLLPIYDFGSVKEDKLDDPDTPHFNWGYDPVNYNVPEGSYSSDPYDGFKRVVEMKQMVKGLHDAGLSVIMDVVYNHVYDSGNFCFNKIVPGYFSRPDANFSGCGNDTASELPMTSKYIIDSVYYWADEYHIDGFRFDLVGLIDVDTINGLMNKVKAERPDVVYYGEGWVMDANNKVTLCTQGNSTLVPGFAFFSDSIRNLLKGGTFNGVTAGFISGGTASVYELLACFQGMPKWCKTPTQSINYISCHDNNTLYDHITMVTNPLGYTAEQRVSVNKLGAAFIMTAQGIPFFMAGEEILRSKPNGKWVVDEETGKETYVLSGTFNENSYNAPDLVNAIKWQDLEDPAYQAVYQYYKGLIAFRKAHPALRLTDANTVKSNVTEVKTGSDKVVAYNIKGGVNGEEAANLMCIFNSTKEAYDVKLPDGNWKIYVNGEYAGTDILGFANGTLKVDALSAFVLVQDADDVAAPGDAGETPTEPNGNGSAQNNSKDDEKKNDGSLLLIICCAVAALSVSAIVITVVLVAKKKN